MGKVIFLSRDEIRNKSSARQVQARKKRFIKFLIVTFIVLEHVAAAAYVLSQMY